MYMLITKHDSMLIVVSICNVIIVDNVGLVQPQQDMDVSEDEPMIVVPYSLRVTVGDKGVVHVHEFVPINNNGDSFESQRMLYQCFNDFDVVSSVGLPRSHPPIETPTTVDIATILQSNPHVSFFHKNNFHYPHEHDHILFQVMSSNLSQLCYGSYACEILQDR